VTICPTHIDIRQGLQLECINCLECVDACTTVMAKFNEPSLVNWSSTQEIDVRDRKTNFFRPKIWGYAIILVGLLISLIVMGVEKELMLLNVNKDSRLYDVEKVENKLLVENSYRLLIQNTQNKVHTYYLEVEGNDKIKISKPSHSFKIKPGEQKKKSLVLYTTEMLSEDERQDTMIHLKLKAYAVDANETIYVERDIRFTYPRKDIVDKNMNR
jgi:cytochrome c oxidase accessory protein FixG